MSADDDVNLMRAYELRKDEGFRRRFHRPFGHWGLGLIMFMYLITVRAMSKIISAGLPIIVHTDQGIII